MHKYKKDLLIFLQKALSFALKTQHTETHDRQFTTKHNTLVYKVDADNRQI